MTAAAVQIESDDQGNGGQTGASTPSKIAGIKIVSGSLYRARQGCGIRFSAEPPPAPRPTPAPVRRPARVAVQLALAHALQDSVDQGLVPDYAAVARRLGLTRARITQLLDLTLLAPDLQEQILFLESTNGVEPLSERRLREVIATLDWTEQRRRWTALPRHTAGRRSKPRTQQTLTVHAG